MTPPSASSDTPLQTPTRRPTPHDRLAAPACRMPAFQFEARRVGGSQLQLLHVGEGISGVLPIDARAAIAAPQRVLAMIHPEDVARLAGAMDRALRAPRPLSDELRATAEPGRTVWLAVHAQPSAQPDGSVLWQGWAVDVTERRRVQQALADCEQLHRRLFDANPIPMWVHDRLTLAIMAVNDAAIAHYGWTREEFLGMTLVDLRHPAGDAAGEAAGGPAPDAGDAPARTATAHHRLKGGRVIEVELAWQPLTWEGRPSHLMMATDVTARRRAEAEIQRLAYYDTLTQLPNRRLLTDRLRQSLASVSRSGSHGAVLFIDLDDFKRVNDTRGHLLGDQVLIEAAARLKGCLRAEDTIARVGGDEFVAILERLDTDARQAAARADEAAQRVMSALSRPLEVPGLRFHSSASIGVAMFGRVDDRVEDVLMHADSAMYRAKAAGRGTVRFYDPAMQVALQLRAALETDLRRALSEGQLRLAYQLQVDARNRAVGAEVLLRWQHPERGPIPPMDFIPLAEETGLIVPIGQWVLETACMQLAGWAREPATRELRLSVNVSARQFRQPDFVQRVERALNDNGAEPSRLRLELTESLLLDNINDCIAKMQSLKSIGVGFALDDFGTGYSSLSYLKRLPLDELKIDRSFIRDIATDPSDAVIVQTIIGMANNLGLTVIAEGVETAEQVAFLGRHGCGAYQGWFFGRPVPLPDFEAALSGGPAPLPAVEQRPPARGTAAPAGPTPAALARRPAASVASTMSAAAPPAGDPPPSIPASPR
jgi:diguanylate cyclase (GGDEF)-like protein/PAS domain S-box-containing protein